MKSLFTNLTGNYSSTASVVDGTLILSLLDAVTPTVWQMELGHARASALELRKQDDHNFLLVLKTPRGDVHDIAPFDNRGRAVAALQAASRAMEQARGQLRPVSNGEYRSNTLPALYQTKHNDNGKSGKILTGVIVAALLVIAINVALTSRHSTAPQASTAMSAAISAPTAAEKPESGAPISADDYLRAMGQ
jgi:hypothetical protein